MSNFLSGSTAGEAKIVNPGAKQDFTLSEFERPGTERGFFEKVFRNEILVPGEFVTWMMDQFSLRGFEIPITQVLGFASTTATAASVATAETTASTSYVDLTTTGPSLAGLGSGLYLVIHSCKAYNVNGFNSVMSYSVNGAAAADANAAISDVNTGPPTLLATSTSALGLVTLSADTNTIVAKYRSGGGATGSTFQDRNIIALKYGNI